MRYYTIQNNGILTAETRQALERFYDNVLELPEDYEQGKYIVVDGELVLNPNWEEERFKIAKEKKLKENEIVREQFLVSGVEYKDILWDSDIEQKLNISIQVSQMSDEDTIDWVAMDGITSLECTKEDLLNIGALLTQMTAYVWQYKNPTIKTMINNAQTIEEVNAIQIVYDMSEIVPPEPELQPVDDDSDTDIDTDNDSEIE